MHFQSTVSRAMVATAGRSEDEFSVAMVPGIQ